jgi:DNA-binding MarR family transcriptional regulator
VKKNVDKPKFSSDRQKAIVEIRMTSQYVGHIMETALMKYDLSAPQFNILRILRGAGTPLNMQSVKERMIENSPNATRLMDKLFDKGLISRVRCEKDRRVVYVQIVEQGLKLLAEVDKDEDWKKLQEVQDRITDEEANQLMNILTKICPKCCPSETKSC